MPLHSTHAGDVLLAVYIMYECSKGTKSFYHPFIRTLPEPESITSWSDEMLLKFEVRRVTQRRARMRVNTSP